VAVDWELVAFIALSILEIGGSIMVIASKKLVHAVFWLAMTLITIGGVYLLFRAEFVFLIQILVYAGAVPVLFLFGIMLTRRKIMEEVTPGEVPQDVPPEAPKGGGP
jgi:NADH:ubiquinone oxidoreductase subunit 6 (subunit J)